MNDAYVYKNSDVLKNLQQKNFLKQLPQTGFVKHFAHYFDAINHLHPFREGNGRVQRTFMGLLAHEAGYFVSWNGIDQKSWAAVCSNGAEILVKVFENIIVPT